MEEGRAHLKRNRARGEGEKSVKERVMEGEIERRREEETVDVS